MFRKCLILVSMLFIQTVHAESVKPKHCDSNVIMYDWEMKQGESGGTVANGNYLFKHAIDKMLRYAKQNNDECFDAYGLVVDKLLTEKTGDKLTAFNNGDYLVEKLEELSLKKPELVEKITNSNPEINKLWGDYQLYLSQKDQIAEEYEKVSVSIIQDFCQDHYDEKSDASDFGAYMSECEAQWQH